MASAVSNKFSNNFVDGVGSKLVVVLAVLKQYDTPKIQYNCKQASTVLQIRYFSVKRQPEETGTDTSKIQYKQQVQEETKRTGRDGQPEETILEETANRKTILEEMANLKRRHWKRRSEATTRLEETARRSNNQDS